MTKMVKRWSGQYSELTDEEQKKAFREKALDMLEETKEIHIALHEG
jgi:hypothetical protein